ncbi:tetratricopeptide repeat protein [Tichowtungia aerotolerans]|uniref:Tetratricopeptide repeat protein n=1 Tax=Tichowtungia aerotolerans TaxID=2697043 RepID=A0A6P1M2G8_9BACT|nr:tetratricopeptide repeat protein [Tichowtungia aerotolerans]QHI68041.1 tetratricopeptide repeat protein [Tichowtungia aerotolerans]
MTSIRRTKQYASTLLLAAFACQGASLDKAWDEVEYVNYRGAYPLFEQEFRNTPESSEALFGMALCLHYRQPDVAGDKAEAERLYKQLIDQTAEAPGPWRLPAMLNLAQLYGQIDYISDTRRPEKAIELYDQILDEFPDSPLATQALLYRSSLELDEMNPEKARDTAARLRRRAEARPDDPYLYNLWRMVAMASEHPLNQPAEAIDAYRKAEQAGLPPNSRKDILFWRIANLAERINRNDLAIHYYRKIAEELKHTNFAYEASLRLAALEAQTEVAP